MHLCGHCKDCNVIEAYVRDKNVVKDKEVRTPLYWVQFWKKLGEREHTGLFTHWATWLLHLMHLWSRDSDFNLQKGRELFRICWQMSPLLHHPEYLDFIETLLDICSDLYGAKDVFCGAVFKIQKEHTFHTAQVHAVSGVAAIRKAVFGILKVAGRIEELAKEEKEIEQEE